MNPKIDPEVALKKVDAFLEEIEEKKLLKKSYEEGSEDFELIIKEIEGLLNALFSDSRKRIEKYYNFARIYSTWTETDHDSEYIEDVKLAINNLNSLRTELMLFIDSKGMQRETKKETLPKGTLMQHFHGDVQNLALGDINYNTTVYFNALIKAIEASEDIPDEEKGNLIDKIKEIANNPYVAGIGSAAIFEGIKTVLMSKPF